MGLAPVGEGRRGCPDCAPAGLPPGFPPGMLRPCLQGPELEITNCDLELANSPAETWNMKSPGRPRAAPFDRLHEGPSL